MYVCVCVCVCVFVCSEPSLFADVIFTLLFYSLKRARSKLAEKICNS